MCMQVTLLKALTIPKMAVCVRYADSDSDISQVLVITY